MHMRGDPQTMGGLAEYTPGTVLSTVAQELSTKIKAAQEAVCSARIFFLFTGVVGCLSLAHLD